MLSDQRLQIIRDELALKGNVVAGELAARFGVSEDTIRRDLRELARDGTCRRVYGGAVLPAPPAGPVAARLGQGTAEKARLATCAARLIRPGQVVFLDGGSTNIALARAIPASLALTVATNALDVAQALSGHDRVELIVLGGIHDRESGTMLGGKTLRAIGEINADLMFLGSCGVDAAGGATAFRLAEAEVKRAMAAASRALVVAATTAKLGTAAPFRVAEASAITQLIVDRDAPDAALAPFRALGTPVLRA